MKIHLIKTDDVSNDLFERILDLLESKPGGFEFHYPKFEPVSLDDIETRPEIINDKDEFSEKKKRKEFEPFIIESNMSIREIEFPHERKTATWAELFRIAQRHRAKNRIPTDEMVIVLTNIANESNWFATLNPEFNHDGFVHCENWHFFIQCPDEFPIAYEILALGITRNMYSLHKDAFKLVHQHPIGCINDFCANKRDIILKLRTGDICPTCLDNLYERIPMTEINHGLDMIARLRERMLYAQNFRQNKPVSPLLIKKHHEIILPQYTNIEIKLTPLEKTLYFLFLRYPKGIYISNLCDHRDEMMHIYSALTSRGDLREMKERIAELSNATSPSASEKISNIKRKFKEKIGEKLAEPYIIHGRNAQAKKIDLDRNLVQSVDNRLFS